MPNFDIDRTRRFRVWYHLMPSVMDILTVGIMLVLADTLLQIRSERIPADSQAVFIVAIGDRSWIVFLAALSISIGLLAGVTTEMLGCARSMRWVRSAALVSSGLFFTYAFFQLGIVHGHVVGAMLCLFVAVRSYYVGAAYASDGRAFGTGR